MASQLLNDYKQKIKSLTLIPGGGGGFELTLDGDLVYSKLETDQFPDEGEMVSLVGGKLG